MLLFLLLDTPAVQKPWLAVATHGCGFCWSAMVPADLLAAVYQMLKLATTNCKPAAEPLPHLPAAPPSCSSGGGGVCGLPAQAVPGVRPQPHAAGQEAAALPLLPPPGGWVPARVGHRRAARPQQPLHLAHGPPQRPRTPPLCGGGVAVLEDGRRPPGGPAASTEAATAVCTGQLACSQSARKACNKRTPTPESIGQDDY